MNRAVTAFCWTLIHSLWQGTLLAMIAGFLLMLTKRWTAAARYNLVLLLFAGLILVSFFTFIWELNHVYSGNATGSFAFVSANVTGFFFGNIEMIKQVLNNISAYCTDHAAFIVMIWGIIFGVRVIKIPGALLYNRQIKNKQIVQPDLYWKNRLRQLCSALNINKAVVLLESAYMKVPVVIGHLKPVILIPLGLLSSLPAEQVEAILLHELAHVRRNDYLVNIFQHIAETVFFFNPAILWMSSWLKEERENCCDDIALRQTKNKQGLIEALISFKQHELYGYSYATAFPGRKDHLLRRVGRILGTNKTGAALPVKIFYVAAFVLLTAGAVTIVLARGSATKAINKFSVPGSVSKVQDKKIMAAPVKVTAETKKETGGEAIFIIKKNNPVKKIIIAKQQILQKARIDAQKNFLTDAQMDVFDSKQAKKDEAGAKLDAEKAFLDQQKAMMDEQQAKKDQEQALRDQYQAKIAQEKAMKDQASAKADAEQTRINQADALRQKKEEEKIKLQAQPLQ